MADVVISVLLPSRGRPSYLSRSVSSLLDLAKTPDEVEILFATDDDQPTAVSVVGERANFREFRFERLGYQRLHEYVNRLAASARGDYLLLWNDDTEVQTQGWDKLIAEGPPFSVQNPKRDTVKTSDFTIPVVGRPFYEAMGHFALNPYNDAYVSHVAFYTGTAVVRDDISFHHHCIVDAQSRENGSAGIMRFHTPPEVAMRVVDMERVLAAPGYATRFDGYDISEVSAGDLSLPNYEYRARGEVLRARAYHVKRK